MIGLLELVEALIYAFFYSLVLALWALFLVFIAGPMMCMISMLILKMVLGAANMFINMILYFSPSCSIVLGPCKTVIFDFSKFIFPTIQSYIDYIFRNWIIFWPFWTDYSNCFPKNKRIKNHVWGSVLWIVWNRSNRKIPRKSIWMLQIQIRKKVVIVIFERQPNL